MTAFTKKPAFENFRAGLISNGKPLLEKDIVPIQARLVAHLDTVRELLVQKGKRHGDKAMLVEISTTWVGLDANLRDAIRTLKSSWSTDLFEAVETQAWAVDADESIHLDFAARYPDGRYLTGRVLVTF
jgi:hypothetical protein